MSGLSPETCMSHLKSVAVTVLELVFNAQKFRGHVNLATPPFRICLIDCPWKQTCMSYLKTVASTVLNWSYGLTGRLCIHTQPHISKVIHSVHNYVMVI